MKQKDTNNKKAVGITLLLGAVVVGSVFYQFVSSEEDAPVIIEKSNDVYSYEFETVQPIVEDIVIPDESPVVTIEEPVNDVDVVIPSFDEAFAEARTSLGPNHTFFWDGKEYRTNYLEEESEQDMAMQNFADSLTTNENIQPQDSDFSQAAITQ